MDRLGRGRQDRKKCVDKLRRLDVRTLQRNGQLFSEVSSELTWKRGHETVRTVGLEAHGNSVTLSHLRRMPGGVWHQVAYEVELSWTSCTFGGQRAWWLCPQRGCGRRVAILYDASIFACRNCHRLAYRSQSETAADRSVRRANKMRAELGWQPGILLGEGGKPSGMHWRKYARLRTAYHFQAMAALDGIGAGLGVVAAGLTDLRQTLTEVRPRRET